MKRAMQNTTPQLQRMLLTLQKYDTEQKYIAGKEKILADTISCASLKETIEVIAGEELEAQLHMAYKNARATSAEIKEVKKETAKDFCLTRIARYVIEGWSTIKYQILTDFKPYWSYKKVLSMINNILFKGRRLIIPTTMRKEVFKQLHQAHMGIQKTKWIAGAKIFCRQINQ